jgi:23S rRNA pseudouridine955/2504/2580 synthase
MTTILYARDDDAGRRLDRVLRKANHGLPISAIHRLLRKGAVRVNGKSAAADRRVDAGDAIQFEIKNEPYNSIETKTGAPENNNTPPHSSLLKNNILFENEHIVIINKRAGLVVHGENSLASAVSAYLADKIPRSLSFKPGPLHRLDRETSGAIIFSKSLKGAQAVSRGFRERLFCKSYIAIAGGVITEETIWHDNLIRDKISQKTFICDTTDAIHTNAITKVTPLATNGVYTLIRVEIKTGRTHQIRAAAAARGHPLTGDKKYGSNVKEKTFFLHSFSIEFPDDCGMGIEKITAPLPAAFAQKIEQLMPGTFF